MIDTPKVLTDIIQSARVKNFPKGQIMLYQGDVPFEVLILRKGVIKIYDVDSTGNEKILHLVKPGSVTPLAFFSGTKHPLQWHYAALTDCEVSVVPVEQLTEAMQTSPELSLFLMNWFSQEVHELLVRLSSLGKTNARDKVAAALRFLAAHHAKSSRGGWRQVTLPVNHRLLADMTGVTRESVTMIMKNYQADQVIRNPRQSILEINTNRLLESTKPALAV